jgi:hypothetical protein
VQYRNLAVRPLRDVTRRLETAAVWDPKTLTRAAGHFISFVREYRAASAGIGASASRRKTKPRRAAAD